MAGRIQAELKQGRPIGSLEEEAYLNLQRTSNALSQGIAELLRGHDLTPGQYNVLRIIDGEGPLANAEIARRLLVTAPVVTRLASGLVEAGFVERHRDQADRRTVLLTLTPAGRRQATAMRRDLLVAARELIEPLPAGRRAAVAKALDELQVLLPNRPTLR